MWSIAIAIGWLVRIQADPTQPGPTQSLAAHWYVSPGESVKTSQIVARRQVSCCWNQISTVLHS